MKSVMALFNVSKTNLQGLCNCRPTMFLSTFRAMIKNVDLEGTFTMP